MAVTQISKIQIRRGLAQDIGQLASGELAWAIDTQKLYIGNGTLAEGAPIPGNTEILTVGQNSSDLGTVLGAYTYYGQEGGYRVITGPDGGQITRDYQNKFDDFVNLRDYGAVGDGLTDDTAAIQRCIDQTYNRLQVSVAPRTRRAIRCSAGVYKLSAELHIPPYALLIAEGDVTFLQTGTDATCVARLTTTIGEDPAGVVTGSYPNLVTVHGVTLSAETDIDLLIIDAATECVFENMGFTGPNLTNNITGVTLGGTGVHIKSTNAATNKITFRNCRFSGTTYAAYLEANVGTSEVLFDNCRFTSLYQALELVPGSSNPRGIRITNSRVEDVYSSAIYGGPGVTGIVSAFNTYINVGNQSGTDAAPVVPVILFQADNNYSIGDVFSRTISVASDTVSPVPRVESSGYAIISTALDEGFRLGAAHQYAGHSYTAADGQITVFPYVSAKAGIINYTVTRNNLARVGIIKFACDTSGNISYEDDYADTADIGVTLGFSKQSGHAFFNLQAALTDAGHAASVTFDIKTLH